MPNHIYNAQDFVKRSGEWPEWFTTITDKFSPFPDGPWLAGGAIRNLITQQPHATDFDYFFKDQEQLSHWRAYVEKMGAVKVFETENSISYTYQNVTLQAVKIQFYASLEEVIDSFDFTICQFGYDGSQFVIGNYSLFDTFRKRLVLHKLTYPVPTIRRLIKYTKQGYYACAGSMQSILEAVVQNPTLMDSDVKYID